MSSRILLVMGGFALVTAAVVLALRPLLPHGGARSSQLLIRVSNAGTPLEPHTTRVSVHPAGSPDMPLTEASAADPFPLPPGSYDVNVRLSRSGDQHSRWLRGIELSPGQQLTREVDFSAGEVEVKATVGSAAAEAGEVVVYVLAAGEKDVFITSMAAGEPALLATGHYDLRVVWSVESREKGIRWLRNIQLKPGLRTRLHVSFERGALSVEATNAGEPLAPGDVTLQVYRSGDVQQELVDAGLNGLPLGLASGTYDIRATYTAASDSPQRWLRQVEIRNAEVFQGEVEFASGSITVATTAGDLHLGHYDAYVYYYTSGDHQQPVAYTPAGNTVILRQGRYDVRAHFFRSHDQPDVWLHAVQVDAGQSRQHTLAFPSGELLIRAYDASGAELIGDNVFVHVFAAGDHRKPLATARAGESLRLTRGHYDVRARDTREPDRSRWLHDITLDAGIIREHAVTF